MQYFPIHILNAEYLFCRGTTAPSDSSKNHLISLSLSAIMPLSHHAPPPSQPISHYATQPPCPSLLSAYQPSCHLATMPSPSQNHNCRPSCLTTTNCPISFSVLFATSHWLKKPDMGQKVKPKMYLLVTFLYVNVPQN